MNYIWTEDMGAGLHYWNMVNEHLLQNKCVVESKGSNQGILDAVRGLEPHENDKYFLAFDVVYDNMDVMNKYLELKELAAKHAEQIIILDMICFEHIILSFSKLTEWTGTGKTDKIIIREMILSVIRNHKINIDEITDRKTLEYLMGFKKYSTERVIKAVTYELTENDAWTVKGRCMGECWHQNCCVLEDADKKKCNVDRVMSGDAKIGTLFGDRETQKLLSEVNPVGNL
ncbi:MAG: hypothetical protein HFH14_05030 [Lachnospiraceae bacterium]|nr:hypothetical protein [Lachnospiraceae bacterium]